MYILELYFKLKEQFKTKKIQQEPDKSREEQEECKHMFVPIDSTGKVLACSKCGYVTKINPNDYKKQNIFATDNPRN